MKIKVLLATLAISLPASAHGPYTDWKIPGTSASCCNDEDCHPTRARQDENGDWEALHKGEWLKIPRDKILPQDKAGDGRSHICASPMGYVFCFTAGQVRG
jgi:hypothetical protein